MLCILGGELRGRKIPFRPIKGFRPTSHRVREALFDLIGDRIEGAAFLDGFAGSGAVGIEALSRGARHVTFIERQKPLLRAIGRTLEELGVRDRSSLRCLDMYQCIESGTRSLDRFSLVFLDAPYQVDIMELVARRPPTHLLLSDGLLIVERSSQHADRQEGSLFRTKRYGDSTLVLVEAERLVEMERLR